MFGTGEYETRCILLFFPAWHTHIHYHKGMDILCDNTLKHSSSQPGGKYGFNRENSSLGGRFFNQISVPLEWDIAGHCHALLEHGRSSGGSVLQSKKFVCKKLTPIRFDFPADEDWGCLCSLMCIKSYEASEPMVL